MEAFAQTGPSRQVCRIDVEDHAADLFGVNIVPVFHEEVDERQFVGDTSTLPDGDGGEESREVAERTSRHRF